MGRTSEREGEGSGRGRAERGREGEGEYGRSGEMVRERDVR